MVSPLILTDCTVFSHSAGESMVLHKDSAWKETWSKFKDTNPVMQSVFNMKKNYEDSENVFVAWARVVTDKISDVWGKLSC